MFELRMVRNTSFALSISKDKRCCMLMLKKIPSLFTPLIVLSQLRNNYRKGTEGAQKTAGKYAWPKYFVVANLGSTDNFLKL